MGLHGLQAAGRGGGVRVLASSQKRSLPAKHHYNPRFLPLQPKVVPLRYRPLTCVKLSQSKPATAPSPCVPPPLPSPV